ncbi:hypothetical protein, partial [Achromobacter ruhlandii]|uniref:hypothetical protein n=1 Tax=Achromobacter ruhlandii TaxID=72557 RepID=UPI0015820ACD
MTDPNNAALPETHPLPWSALPADKVDLFEGADMWFFNDASGEEVFYGCAMSTAVRDQILEAVNSRALLSKLRAPVADERDRNATISKVVGMCNRIPGATTWNAAEFMYDEMHRRAALAVAGERSAVAYLDLGAGGYMDVGTDLTDEQLAALPKGRHMLAIIGTHGVNGYAPASAPVADERAAFEAWATAIAEKYDVTRNGDHYMEPYTE